jgi:hypothetical protein
VAEVEVGAPGVVEEHAEGSAGTEINEEGNGFVDGVGGFLEAEGVGVPHGEGLSGAVEGAGLVAEAEEVVGGVFLLGDAEAESDALPGDGFGVLLEDVPGEIGDGQAEGGV